MRINALGNTATDFESDDYIAIDGATNGSRKMAKDTLLKLTASNALGYIVHTFDGANTTLLTYSFSAIKGTSIKITPSTTSWNASAISASANKFLIRAILADGTTRDDVGYLRDSTIPATISYIVPNDAVGVQVCFRGNTGESVDFTIENVGVNSIKDTMEKRQLYIPEGSLYIEETRVFNGKIWIKAEGSLWTGRLQGTNINDSNAQFATRLGRSTETSAKGVASCIPIDNLECLVATANGDYAIKTRDNLLPSDAVVLSCVAGALVQANTDIMAAFFDAYIRNGTIREQNFPRQIYGAERDNIYIEESKLNSGKVWLKVYDGLTIRLGTSLSYSNSQLATLFNKTLESSASGMPNCIPLANLDCIFLRNGELKCMTRTNLTNRDVLLLANVNGEVIGGNKELALKLSEPTEKTYVYRNGIDSIYTKFADKIAGTCDKFIFFTDPHCLTSADKARRNFMWLVENIKNIQVPIDFTLSGGDWLSSGDSVVQAIERLGIMTSVCNKELYNFKSLVGNHDTNYLGGERLSNETIGSVMIGGKTYYTFKTANTRYFAFDTGVEEAVTPYEEEQIAWFASALLNNTDSHIGVLAHILTNDYGEGYDSSNFTLYYMASDLMDIAVAFNARTSVTKNGVTYDYSGVTTGYVEFFLGGHTHKDFGRNINNIPVVMTKNYGVYSDPANNAVDLVIPNYTTKKINLIRIGSGSDRNFDLFSASL